MSAPAASTSSSSSSSRKRKEVVNSNAAFFSSPSSAATQALKRWKAEQPVEAAVGVLSIDDDEEPSKATSADQLAAEKAAVNKLTPAAPDTYTTNGALAFSSTQNKRLDLFFQLVRFAEEEQVQQLVADSWEENAEHTLQILMHARDARAGKGERQVTLHALLWLREHKPATYLHNLLPFLSLGYFKDLLNIAAAVKEKKMAPLGASTRKNGKNEIVELEVLAEFLQADWKKLQEAQEKKKEKPAEGAAAPSSSKPATPSVQLSLAAKWAPTEKHAFDRKHKFASRLAHLLFPDSPTALRQYRALLSGCRAELKVAERSMCLNQWEEIQFEQLPAKCHQLIKKALKKHCGERYNEYLAQLKAGKATIKTSGVMPYELAGPYISPLGTPVREADETIEGAWRTIVEKLRTKGAANGGLGKAIAMADVSGSMTCFNNIPMKCSISLSLLIAELASPPFQGRVLTFSESPKWHQLPESGSSLFERVQSLSRADWGMSTNLEASFDLILQTAVESKCKPEDLPTTLFIFSDMQFNHAVKGGAELMRDTLYDKARREFRAAGYELPNVVFWNLNGAAKGFPVDVTTPGVAMIGGFSAELLKSFLEGVEVSPMAIMLDSIAPYKTIIEESER